MNPKIVIRSETDADVSAITEVTAAAFKNLEISKHTEQFIIAALRDARGPDGIAYRRIRWACGRAYCFLSCEHFRWHSELVRPWTCFGVAGVPAARYRQSPDTGRAVAAESDECSRMLSRGASGLLQEIRVRKHAGTCA